MVPRHKAARERTFPITFSSSSLNTAVPKLIERILSWALIPVLQELRSLLPLLQLCLPLLLRHSNSNNNHLLQLLFLIFLTQFNDVAQYTWGKMFGRRKIIPGVSPNKTWEGFLGGVGTTFVMAIATAPLVTPFSLAHAAAAGLLIPVAGFIGDVTVSALKRDLGVKDTGSLIPGHGGILDRIDSLTFTAPLFFHFTRYFYY